MLEFTFINEKGQVHGEANNIADCLRQANLICQAHYWRLTTIWELTKKECKSLLRHYTAHSKPPKKPYLSQHKIGTLAIRKKTAHDA